MSLSTLPPPLASYLVSMINRTTFTAAYARRSGVSYIQTPKISRHRQLQAKAGLHDYFQQSTYNLLTKSDGGPPRWFTPLESASCFDNPPLLLALPGMDGNGHALVLQHQRLGQIFEIWCLHIPTTDRTPFTDLVKMVERTVRSESYHFPNRPIYIVGESSGASLALAVAARTLDIDLVLILANPATSFGRFQLQPLLSFLKVTPVQILVGLPYLMSLVTGVPSRMMMATSEIGLPLQQQGTDLSQDVAALFSNVFGLSDVLNVETLLWKLKMVESAYEYSNSRIRSVSAQTLILFSGRDQLFPSLEGGVRLRQILPNCHIRTLSDSGHPLFPKEGVDLVKVIKEAGFYRCAKHTHSTLDLLPPSPLETRTFVDFLRWTDVATSPVLLSTLENGKIVRGLDGIPCEGPVLFVGYHNLFALEVIPMIRHFIIERNINLRALAHPLLVKKFKEINIYDSPTYDFLRIMGAVPISASNLYRLLSMKSHVILYPGGVREALHRKGEEYKLSWPKQSEFVRMAAAFGAKIIPFGAVGEDDFSQLVLDYNDQMKIPFMKGYMESLTNETVKLRQVVIGLVKKNLQIKTCMCQHCYQKSQGDTITYFGKPIETLGRKQELRKREKADAVYSEVKCEVEKCLAYLLRRREKDPYRNITARFMYQATHGGLDSQVPTFNIY